MRPDDADGFREAWAILERLWEETVARARTFPEAELHRSVDDEWSFIQTLRHLNFATRRLGGPDGPRQRLAVAPAGPAVGRGARMGRHPVGPRRRDPRSTRCSRSGASARRWSAASWSRSPTSSSPRR